MELKQQSESVRIPKGLTTAQAAEAAARGERNEAAVSASKSVKEIICGNVLTYYNLIFAILAGLVILAGSFRDLTFLVVVLANMGIGIVQELRSKQMLDRLRLMSEPKATAIRDGQKKQLPVDELVRGDVIELRPGQQIPADAVVETGTVNVNEALLTGEADEIAKSAGDELLSGSFIVSGTCCARLTKVGKESYISQLTLQATRSKHGEQSEMIRSLNRMVKIVGILIIPIGVVLFLQQYLTGATVSDSIIAMVAAVLGMIPEGLYLLASVAMVVSAMRLASNRVLIHDMKCIETLARVDVLCVDKTGTITAPQMKVAQWLPLIPAQEAEIRGKLASLTQYMTTDNATMAALQQYFRSDRGTRPLRLQAFSSEFKYSGMVCRDGAYVLGAPEFVLRDQLDTLRTMIDEAGAQGHRVLVFAKYQGELTGGQLTAPAEPLALLMLSNPVRREAPETFRYFAENDVQIKVISGDNPVTVSHVAQQAGIASADAYIDASALKTAAELEEAVAKYTVFGRVTPTQKREMVRALKKQGRTVGMTGDGVNDVLALKEADCSVAMASGSDAAAQVAQLVLLDSDFSKMPDVVREGRRVVNNIERSASLFLIKNIYSFLLALFSLASFFSYPLRPSQVSLISMFTIGIPSFLLALEPNHSLITGHFLPNVLRKALPAGITSFVCVATMVLYSSAIQMQDPAMSTICTLLVSFVGFMVLRYVAAPFTWQRGVIFGLLVAAWGFSVLNLKPLFAIEPLSAGDNLLLAILCVASITVFRYANVWTDFLWQRGSAFFAARRAKKSAKPRKSGRRSAS